MAKPIAKLNLKNAAKGPWEQGYIVILGESPFFNILVRFHKPNLEILC